MAWLAADVLAFVLDKTGLCAKWALSKMAGMNLLLMVAHLEGAGKLTQRSFHHLFLPALYSDARLLAGAPQHDHFLAEAARICVAASLTLVVSAGELFLAYLVAGRA